MKMKTLKYFLFALIMFSAFYSNGQDSTSIKKYRHEIGLDATYVLKAILLVSNYNPSLYSTFDTTITTASYNYNLLGNSYILNYNFFFNEKIGLRFGYGQYITNTNANEDAQSNPSGLGSTLSNTTSNQEIKRTFIYSRLGAVYIIDLNKKWQSYIGLDFVNAYKDIYYKKEVDYPISSYMMDYTSTTRSVGLSFGLGPTIGIKYKITDRVLLSTESSLYYIYSSGVSDYDYRSTPNQSVNFGQTHNTTHTYVSGWQINLNMPLVLFLTIKF